MSWVATWAPQVSYGLLACVAAIVTGAYLILGPRPVRLPMDRRRPVAPPTSSHLTQAAVRATGLIDSVLRRRGNAALQVAMLERAGVSMRLQDFALMLGAAALVAAALGVVLVGPLLGLGLAIAVLLAARVLLNLRIGRRRSAFANQLDDSLQLIASSLRAGHSLLQALASVSREAEEPTAGEFARIINETRVGREMSAALDETAARMESEDFVWVTQAIAINREVGGNLAEVLDGVGNTIRERNQIRRQVQALSAEGKLSAYVLMALPIGVGGFLSFSNPSYIHKFVESIVGYGLLAVSVVMFVVGGLWLRKVVSLKF